MSRNGQAQGALWLVLLMLLTGAAPALAQRGELVGRVVASGTNEPVTAASVVLVGSRYEAVTDDGGVFRFRDVPVGKYRLQVQHIGYSRQTVEVEIRGDVSAPVEVTVSAAAVALSPITVEGLSVAERRDRGAGARRSLLTREQIERAENTQLNLADLLTLALPTVRVRRHEKAVGSPVCVELRTVRAMQAQCLSPVVVLDGVPISNPTTLYDNIDTRMIESVEILNAAEASTRYGSGALYGAILISTRRPGAAESNDMASRIALGSPNFDWELDPSGHRTARVFVSSALANGIGLAVGVAAASQCIGLRKPANDGIISECSIAPTLGTAAAAILLPALASSVASGLAGNTHLSRGEFAPAILGATMTILPGYALVFSGHRNNSETLNWIGYGVIVLGPPLITTGADYLFRKLKGDSRN